MRLILPLFALSIVASVSFAQTVGGGGNYGVVEAGVPAGGFTLDASGTIEWDSQVEMSSPSSGCVKWDDTGGTNNVCHCWVGDAWFFYQGDCASEADVTARSLTLDGGDLNLDATRRVCLDAACDVRAASETTDRLNLHADTRMDANLAGTKLIDLNTVALDLAVQTQFPTNGWINDSYVLLTGEGVASDGMSGMYDRNELLNTALRGTTTVAITGAGSFTAGTENLLTDASAGNFFTINGTDVTTTQVVITFDTGAIQPNYATAFWQPFMQYRTAVRPGQYSYFDSVDVEISDDGITYYQPSGGQWTTTDLANEAQVPSYWFGGRAKPNTPGGFPNVWRYARFTLTERIEGTLQTAPVWISEMGIRHRGAPWARQYTSSAGDTFYGDVTLDSSDLIADSFRLMPDATDARMVIENNGGTAGVCVEVAGDEWTGYQNDCSTTLNYNIYGEIRLNASGGNSPVLQAGSDSVTFNRQNATALSVVNAREFASWTRMSSAASTSDIRWSGATRIDSGGGDGFFRYYKNAGTGAGGVCMGIDNSEASIFQVNCTTPAEIKGRWGLVEDTAPSAPVTCDATNKGYRTVVDDTDDGAGTEVCYCGMTDDTTYDWLQPDGTACSFF